MQKQEEKPPILSHDIINNPWYKIYNANNINADLPNIDISLDCEEKLDQFFAQHLSRYNLTCQEFTALNDNTTLRELVVKIETKVDYQGLGYRTLERYIQQEINNLTDDVKNLMYFYLACKGYLTTPPAALTTIKALDQKIKAEKTNLKKLKEHKQQEYLKEYMPPSDELLYRAQEIANVIESQGHLPFLWDIINEPAKFFAVIKILLIEQRCTIDDIIATNMIQIYLRENFAFHDTHTKHFLVQLFGQMSDYQDLISKLTGYYHNERPGNIIDIIYNFAVASNVNGIDVKTLELLDFSGNVVSTINDNIDNYLDFNDFFNKKFLTILNENNFRNLLNQFDYNTAVEFINYLLENDITTPNLLLLLKEKINIFVDNINALNDNELLTHIVLTLLNDPFIITNQNSFIRLLNDQQIETVLTRLMTLPNIINRDQYQSFAIRARNLAMMHGYYTKIAKNLLKLSIEQDIDSGYFIDFIDDNQQHLQNNEIYNFNRERIEGFYNLVITAINSHNIQPTNQNILQDLRASYKDNLLAKKRLLQFINTKFGKTIKTYDTYEADQLFLEKIAVVCPDALQAALTSLASDAKYFTNLATLIISKSLNTTLLSAIASHTVFDLLSAEVIKSFFERRDIDFAQIEFSYNYLSNWRISLNDTYYSKIILNTNNKDHIHNYCSNILINITDLNLVNHILKHQVFDDISNDVKAAFFARRDIDFSGIEFNDLFLQQINNENFDLYQKAVENYTNFTKILTHDKNNSNTIWERIFEKFPDKFIGLDHFADNNRRHKLLTKNITWQEYSQYVITNDNLYNTYAADFLNARNNTTLGDLKIILEKVKEPAARLDLINKLQAQTIKKNLKYLALDYLKDVDYSEKNDLNENIITLQKIKQTVEKIHNLMLLAVGYLIATLVVAAVLVTLWLTLGTTALLVIPGAATLSFGALAGTNFFQAKAQQKKLDTICSAKPE